jgi:Protein of unknown function (DUF4239)
VLRGVLNTFPVDLIMFAAASLAFGAVVLAVWAVRRRVPVTREGFHAEISAPMLGVAATLFGLLLAFVIIIGYQNFLDADSSVSSEAGALASIVRDSAAFPAPGGTHVRLAVGSYVRAVVYDEWRSMHDSGKDSALAANGFDGISAALRTVEPTSRGETAFYDDAVSQLNAAVAAREDRLEKAAGGLPRDLVELILFSTVVIVGYAVFVGSPNFWFHVLGPAAIATVVAVSLVVLLDLAYPFSGILSISPDHFKTGDLAQFFTPR